jgi:hypothetical protein
MMPDQRTRGFRNAAAALGVDQPSVGLLSTTESSLLSRLVAYDLAGESDGCRDSISGRLEWVSGAFWSLGITLRRTLTS